MHLPEKGAALRTAYGFVAAVHAAVMARALFGVGVKGSPELVLFDFYPSLGPSNANFTGGKRGENLHGGNSRNPRAIQIQYFLALRYCDFAE